MNLSPIDLARCQEIRDPFTGMARVVEEIADASGLTVAEIRGNRRWQHVCAARQLAFFVCRELGYSTPQIGKYFNRDHTTVLHGIDQEEKRRAGIVQKMEAVQ